MGLCAQGYRCLQGLEEGISFHGAGIAGDRKLPDVDTGTPTLVLCKDSACFSLLSSSPALADGLLPSLLNRVLLQLCAEHIESNFINHQE